MNRVIGIVMIAMAVTMALIPVFTDCESQGKHIMTQEGRAVPMKCHWTGLAALGAAAPLALAGALALKRRRRETTSVVAGVGAVSGIMAISFPTALIGVCANPMMPCSMIMQPALVAAGILAVVASAVLALVGWRAAEMESAPAQAGASL